MVSVQLNVSPDLTYVMLKQMSIVFVRTKLCCVYLVCVYRCVFVFVCLCVGREGQDTELPNCPSWKKCCPEMHCMNVCVNG